MLLFGLVFVLFYIRLSGSSHLDKDLTWNHQIYNVTIKLNKANVVLSKIRHCVDMKTLKSMYRAIAKSHLSEAFLVWVWNSSSVEKLHVLPEKWLKLKFFLNINVHTGLSFKNSKILKFSDKFAPENCFLLFKSFHENTTKNPF